MKNKTITKRLYRALRSNELILTSQLVQNHRLPPEFVPLNEFYSHIVPTYKLRETSSYRTVFSFTENLSVAKKMLKDYPDTYVKIGYIDVDLTDAFTINNPNILFAMPVFRVSDWVELMSYSYDSHKNINNLNYHCKDISFINAIIYSRWSAMSLANSNKEYLLICDGLVPTILDNNTQPDVLDNISIKPETKDFLIKDYNNNIAVIKLLKTQLKPLKISNVRKELLNQTLNELLVYYNSRVA